MKRKKLFTLVGSICLILVLAALLLPACAKEEAPPPTAEFQWPRLLKLVTDGVGSSTLGALTGVAAAMERDLGIKVRVTPETVTTQKVVRAATGEFHFGQCGTDDYACDLMGLFGAVVHEPGHLADVWYFGSSPWPGPMVRGDSPLQTIYDLANVGKDFKFAALAVSPGCMQMMDGILGFVGLTRADIEVMEIPSYTMTQRLVTEGGADMAIVAATSAATFESAATPKGIRFLEMPASDRDGWLAFLEQLPVAVPGTTTTGVPEAQGLEGFIIPYCYITSPSQDQELVYNLAKWLQEKNDLHISAGIPIFKATLPD